MSKDINRLRLFWLRKNEQISGSQNNLEKILPPFPNGALIHATKCENYGGNRKAFTC